MAEPELSVVIPAYNEARHLESVVLAIANTLRAATIQYEICVVNNGSQDETEQVIARLAASDPCITTVTIPVNQGYGGGVQAGLSQARGNVVGWVHADGQADPNDIVRLFRKMQAEGKALGKAVRMQSSESGVRKMLSAAYFAVFQVLFWSPYRDMNGTPKLMTKDAHKTLRLGSKDWFIDPEFVIKALRYRMPIAEIDTIWHGRKSGGTKARLALASLEFLKNMLLYRTGIK